MRIRIQKIKYIIQYSLVVSFFIDGHLKLSFIPKCYVRFNFLLLEQINIYSIISKTIQTLNLNFVIEKFWGTLSPQAQAMMGNGGGGPFIKNWTNCNIVEQRIFD